MKVWVVMKTDTLRREVAKGPVLVTVSLRAITISINFTSLSFFSGRTVKLKWLKDVILRKRGRWKVTSLTTANNAVQTAIDKRRIAVLSKENFKFYVYIIFADSFLAERFSDSAPMRMLDQDFRWKSSHSGVLVLK